MNANGICSGLVRQQWIKYNEKRGTDEVYRHFIGLYNPLVLVK